MSKTLTQIAIAALALLLATERAPAQRPNIGRPIMRRPTTSAYLNLLRRPGGGGIGFNYFQRVRPELEFRAANRSLRQQLNAMQQQRRARSGGGLGTTGHPVQFLNTGGYFPGFGNR